MRDPVYDASILPEMVAACRRQRAKDALFVETLTRYLRPGNILEIGAGCGQLSELLAGKGYTVTASDIKPFLVEYMASRGLNASVLDATNLGASIDRKYDNVLGGGPTPLITTDLATVRQTYESVRTAMKPHGRFVLVLPIAYRNARFSKANDHARIASAAGFDLIHRFRQQALPSSLYARLPAPLVRAVESSVGRIVGVRWVFVFGLSSIT